MGRLMGLAGGGRGGLPIGAQPLSSVLARRAFSCSLSCGAPRLGLLVGQGIGWSMVLPKPRPL